jgi:cilia- and flagella-associated protein 44
MGDLPALAQLTQSLGIGDLGKDLIGLHHISGNDIFRRNNFLVLDRKTIGYASGSSVIIENIETSERKYLLSLDDGGVGCIAIHPTRKYLAVGCRGSQPNIYIYEFPSLKVSYTSFSRPTHLTFIRFAKFSGAAPREATPA